MSLALAFLDTKHGRRPSRWSAARVLAPHQGLAWPFGRHATTRRWLAAPPNGPRATEQLRRAGIAPPHPTAGKTHPSAGHHRAPTLRRESQTTRSCQAGPLWTARHPRLRRPRDRPNQTRIPWTRSALIQDCHETRTRLPYGEAPTADYGGAMEMCRDSRGSVRTRTETRTRLAVWQGAPADYGGAMRDNLSRRPPICNKRLYHDRSTNRGCHGSNGAVSSASDLLHHRSQVMRRTETATDLH